MRVTVFLLAGFFVCAPLFGQTAAVKPKTASGKAPVRRSTTAAKTTAAKTATKPAAGNSAEANAPGIPVASGEVKTLYALKYVDLVVGTGELAVPRKWYTVHYTGWTTDGKKFDSSVDRGQPFNFPYGGRRVIAAWDTGFEGMRIGGKRRLIAPYQLAYGEQGNQGIPPKATLIFDVELLGMSDTPPPPPGTPAESKPVEDPVKPAAPAGTPTPDPAAKPGSITAPGTPGHPDPAKLPGAPPTGE